MVLKEAGYVWLSMALEGNERWSLTDSGVVVQGRLVLRSLSTRLDVAMCKTVV